MILEPLDEWDAIALNYTSGTTGQPKGVVRDNGGYCVALAWSMQYLYGIQPGEVWWCASDVGWVVGHSYIVYGPLLAGMGLPPALLWIELAALQLVRLVLWTYFFAIFLYATLALIAPGTYSPAQSLLGALCEPVLRPIRRLIPPLANLDLSPLWAGILIQALLILLR